MTSHPEPAWLAIVREKVETLRYGVVQIVIHDSQVTQVERTEKIRIASCEKSNFPNRPDTLDEASLTSISDRASGRRS